MNELKKIVSFLDKVAELEKYKMMWETVIKELEKLEMSGKQYGITFILHLMQDIEKEIKE